RWAKPVLVFFGIILIVIAIAGGFFAYTAATMPSKMATVSESHEETTQLLRPSPSPSSSTIGKYESKPPVLGVTTLQLNPLKLFLLINAHRENFHLPKLSSNAKLTASAQLKLDDMIEKGYYRHADENDQSTWHFIQVTGYDYSKAGENLAFNIGSEWDVFQAWLESSTHNKQMLDPDYTDVGIAIDCDSIKEPNYKCIVVAHFGKQ
ncbi:hypothetical protein KC721_02410, partial [Candidatus Woesebacteria bacterium]|nr:hypothetical protein [Candidatus Woesebacteria bacterium]